MRGLPEGWVEVELGEVVEPKETRNPLTDGSASFRYVDVQAVDNARNRVASARKLPSRRAPSRARRLLRANDVLFCLVRPYLRNVALVPPELDGEVASTAFCVLRPNTALASRFLFHQVLRDSFIGELPTYGTSPPAAREDELLKQRIVLAPLPEQHRIIAKIGDLFAKLDEGVAALKRAQADLERYRTSVLKAAVEGRLTEQWRKRNPPEETGEQLLGRILTERRKRWEEDQLAKFAAKGRKPPRNWNRKYKEPMEPDAATLPKLPGGWCWATVDQVGSVGSGITKGGKKRDAPRRAVPYLRVANVQMGYLDLRVIKTILASDDEIRRYSLKSGDVLFNEGGDRDKLGRGWVWSGDLAECLHQNHVFRVRPFLRDYSSEFLSHYGNSAAREWFFRRATQSVNLASMNQTVLRSLPVPLPPLREQRHIVHSLTTALGSAETAASEFTRQLDHATTLRQSILKRAFEGRLVPQEPDAESASVILKRPRPVRQSASRSTRRDASGQRPTLDCPLTQKQKGS